MIRKLIVPVLMCLLMVIPIIAPAAVVNVPTDIGLNIEYPLFSYLKKDESVTFAFHVYNTSNGLLLTNKTVDCYFHLYDSIGQHIIQINDVIFADEFDFEANVDGSYFKEIGEYAYLFHCNNTHQGGFVTNTFVVNDSGRETFSFSVVGACILLLAMITILIILGYVFYTQESWMMYLSYLCWFVGLLIPLFGINLLLQSNLINDIVRGTVETLYTVYLWTYMTLLLFFVVYLLHLVITWIAYWNKTPPWKRKRLNDRVI